METKIFLRDRNQELVDAWKACFREFPEVEASCGDIFDIPATAIVSPANSFGFMNGGIDAVYTRRFGPELQADLQDVIHKEFNGELLVGQATVIPIKDDPARSSSEYEFLISAPTMRVPMDVSGSVNAYLAFRAVLRAWDNEMKVAVTSGVALDDSILCPGLGTAVGQMSYQACAVQMAEAYRAFKNGPKRFDFLGEAFNCHEKLRRGV
jgi:O-acetyl-ADP-ribose deacetylase (regulator of RNase III)